MRIYQNFKEAHNEVKRDLAEMGIRVHPHSYQNKNIKDDPAFETVELQNYMYCVTQPRLEDLTPTQPWADAEFEERISRDPVNPGEAWKLRPDVWEQFINDSGRFDYTYGGRLSTQYKEIINELKFNPDSRQLYLGVWDRVLDSRGIGGWRRIPCTLGYLFQARQGQLHMTYLMRSSDFITHFQNDVYLAFKMQCWIAGQAGIPVGRFTHYMGSLHVFQKDIGGIF